MAKARHLRAAIAEVCLGLPETEEFLSHGAPNFRVRKGRVFAIFTVNHHGDGRIALWLASDSATQDHLTRTTPRHFFVPPYLGPRGWLGVRLDRGLSWRRISSLVQEAYRRIAPPRLSATLGTPRDIRPPTIGLTLAELDPMHSTRALRLTKLLDDICGEWPGVERGTQHGATVWRAGKRTFAQLSHTQGRLHAGFWVGIDRQPMMTLDPRFHVPPFIGAQGWIALALEPGRPSRRELRELAAFSREHFSARKRTRS